MRLYYYIALVAILSQLPVVALTYSNYCYALQKYKKKRQWQMSRTALIVPCRGLDSEFRANIASFFNQDYENYLLWFVVADKSDPAYDELCRLKSELSQRSKARDVQILVAGIAQSCSQKIHNLLYCCQKLTDDVEILAFADSDICVRSDWLSHLVWPLHRSKTGVASGYRWFIPKKNNLASLVLSAINAKVAQLLGNTPFNQAWGGSMAIRVEVFRRLGIEKIWSRALSDDLLLSRAVKKAGMKVVFVPACLVASYTSTTWRELFEFGRRQFLITRISAPRTWWFALLTSLYSVLGVWGGTGLVVYAAHEFLAFSFEFLVILAVPIVFLARQLIQAILRQKMISRLLEKHLPQMKAAISVDILGFWIWPLLVLSLVLSSAFGRTIRWRGIRYKLLGPTEIIVMGGQS
jgi:cellulose synthase/poly-beta-1,6-N-acetylglucosamine synthase-like glycosyltransferase